MPVRRYTARRSSSTWTSAPTRDCGRCWYGAAKGDKVGEVGCWYYHQTLWAAWYDNQTGVVGAASIPGKTAGALLDYLDRTKLT